MRTSAPSLFPVPTRDTVSPANQALFDALLKGVGMVPNLYATFAHSETALGAYLALQGRKTLLDAFVLWTIHPTLRLRLSASNLLARDYETGGSVAGAGELETARTTLRTSVLWQVRMEMKL